ncbi:hypothetical protein ONZ45_g2694 [Pleurotus djamor]|nr:hypothetical protein ONZ45_g2694 [Pleurotus djamor]
MQLLLLSSFFLAAHAAILPKTNSHPTVVHEKRNALPLGWQLTRRYEPSTTIPLKFALTQSNLDKLEDYLNEVSHPKSPSYGDHWTAGKIAETFAPSHETISTVRNWLVGSGIPSERIKVSPTRGWINLDVTIAEAEELLKTEYNVYIHDTGKEHIGCEEYHLPEHVAPHVDLVLPSVHFDAQVHKRDDVTAPLDLGQPGFGRGPKTTGGLPSIPKDLEFHTTDAKAAAADYCWLILTPDCLRTLYNFHYTPQATDKNSFGVVEYTPQAFLQSDLDMFHFNYSREIMGKTPDYHSIVGGVLQTQVQNFAYNGESDLDLEYAMNLATVKQNITLYQVGDMVQGASFNNFLDAIDSSYCSFEGGDDTYQDPHYPNTRTGGWKGPAECGTVKPANVISTSYGYNEADLSFKYATRQCAEYAKLGLMGITMIFSSGDSGVGGNAGVCFPDQYGPVFNPGFPASCPFVTVVGATQINKNAPVSEPEAAIDQVIASGGGFSNYFTMPDYQKDHVTGYLTNFPPTQSTDNWNATGAARAFPDIAANGANFVAAVNGQFILVYGTSASTPVIGAMLTMINDARLAAGKKTIGFINPTIYSADFADAFNDITSGTNPGCGSTGFDTAAGWDPVTGLGTFDFQKLLDKWLALP